MGLYKEEKRQESRQHNRVRGHKDSVSVVLVTTHHILLVLV